jgi:hypothetical protein
MNPTPTLCYLDLYSSLQLRSQRHVGLNPSSLVLQTISIGLHNNYTLAILLVLGKRLIAVKVLVDDSTHALTAVIAKWLAAVVPEWFGVVDLKCEDALGLALRGGEVEAREDAGLVSWERHTWLFERRLHNGVVLDGNQCAKHYVLL